MRGLKFFWIPIVAVLLMSLPAPSSAQIMVGLTIGQPPPPLPVYNSIPVAPAPNYIWQPGYWAWGAAGYYWVPGTWTMAPQTGLYWTPGYWGYNNGYYGWNNGYWAPQVGFYGGINYGFGYPGTGFYGGQWGNNGFAYNTAVWPVGGNVTNVYVNRTVINKTVINRTSYNGGRGGVQMHPDAQQLQVAHMRHVQMTPDQVAHARAAERDRDAYASVNKGHPQMVTAQKPLDASYHPQHPQSMSSEHHNAPAQHPMSSQQHPQNAMHSTNQHPQSTEHHPPAQAEHKAAPADKNKPPSDQDKDKKPPSR